MYDATLLELSALSNGTATTVYVGGDVDIATVQRFHAFLHEQLDYTRVLLKVDLADVTYLSPEGLRTLVDLRAHCARRRIIMVMGECSPVALHMFELADLGGVLFGQESTA